MEYFSRLLRNMAKDSKFKYHPKCAKEKIIRLGFADDLLLFCKGDIESVQLLFESFQLFSKVSGLTARYLGVPLSSKRLSMTQCRPLLDKMLDRITNWTTKFLSYAGRVILIKSVLFAIQTIWAQIFILPKKIVKQIITTCKRFLWTGAKEENRALLAWDTLCHPKSAGGLNFIDIEKWNKAAICKQLWNLSKKQEDTLWVIWVHAYYWKGGSIWNANFQQAFWCLSKITTAGKYVTQAGMTMNELINMEHFSIKNMYQKLRGDYPKVPRRRISCNNIGIRRQVMSWNDELDWAAVNYNGKNPEAELYRMFLQIY
uniref:Uncharacterized protein n=1 Tax=Nicotiana tabacum TaxID=4097 RepID=A0A1S4BSU4_TOBAC|nr:PREDICTED: uncharacterized protein LOC107811523 [Nicotiana tabacum]